MDFADDDDFDLYENEGPGYFYVEDGFDIADELAERVIPDPPGYESEGEWDRYDYWQDIEYDTDGYEDDERLITSSGSKSKRKRPSKAKSSTANASTSKKRKAPSSSSNPNKKRKLQNDGKGKVVPPVELLPTNELRPEPRVDPSMAQISELKSVALPSWRDLVGTGAGAIIAEEIAESLELDNDEAGDDEEMEDDELVEEEEENISPNALQLVLRNHLQQIGLDVSSVDENSLLRLAQSMMANQADVDELLGNFVSSLVGDEEDEEHEDDNDDDKDPKGNAFGKWVSGQAKASAPQKKEASPLQEKHEEPPPEAAEEIPENGRRNLRSSKRRRESPVVSPRKKRATRQDSTRVQA